MRPRCVFLHRGEPRIIIPFVLFPLHYWNGCMKFCNTMHTKTQMTLNPVRGSKLKETPFFGLFPAHSGPLCTALMTFPHIPHQWTTLQFSRSLRVQYITQSLSPLMCSTLSQL
nr:MAG TPA: hypothetical protein [Caudoviricetes sp.]